MDAYETYLSWYESPAVDEETKEELFSISRDRAEIEERFYKELEFGTAGLRGILGAGTNRMNVYVVRRATNALADVVLSHPGGAERGVCIAYDSRRCSKLFAEETAQVLAGCGVKAYLFSTLHSVPQLSFTLQQLGCLAGVVITASHNPPQYNGYKVYWEYGGQASPEQAEAIYQRIRQTDMFSVPRMELSQALAAGAIRMIGPAEDEAYYKATMALLPQPELVRRAGAGLKLVYTPLHGTGGVPVVEILKRIGVTNVSVVPQQALPDGDFPTVTAPNPEDPAAFSLARALAERTGATACLATDPDADRLGVCVKTRAGEWVTLTGNQIGALLTEHILSQRQRAGTLPANGVVIKSVVSGTMADAICARYGVEMENVLTGFRFIGERIDQYARTGEKTYLFGFEESYGFLPGGLARDKDAVCSAMFIAGLIAQCASEGKTLYDALLDMYGSYGFYREQVSSYTLEGKAGLERIAACMEALYAEPPAMLGGLEVEAVENYLSLTRTKADGAKEPIALPRTNMLRLLLAGGAWAVVRPSGTEPKLKLYTAANAPDEAALKARLDGVFGELDARIRSLLQ